MARGRSTRTSYRASWWSLLLAGLAGALLMGLSLPPVGVWPLALAAPAPFIWAGCRSGGRWILAGVLTAVGTLPVWLFETAWLVDVTAPGYPLLSIYMGAWNGLFVAMIAWLRRREIRQGEVRDSRWRGIPMWLAAPAVWVALEFLRGEYALSGYAWFLAAQPLIESWALAAPAAVLGTYFVSCLVVGLAGAVADAAGWSGRARGVGAVGAGAVLFLWLITGVCGVRQLRAIEAGTVASTRIAVVQTNVPQDNKLSWTPRQREVDFKRAEELSRQVAMARPTPHVVVWPETMFPGLPLNPSAQAEQRKLALSELQLDRQLVAMQKELGVVMLIGAEAMHNLRVLPGDGKYAEIEHDGRFNSVYKIEGGQISDTRYDKIEPTPFGERIPLAWRWSQVQRWIEAVGAGGMKFDLATGTEMTVFEVPAEPRVSAASGPGGEVAPSTTLLAKVVTPICFEATRSGLCRRMIYSGEGGRRADVFVNLSNDGWFGWFDGGREQHLNAARWRCIELGVPMVRSVNTGVSAKVDLWGRLSGELSVRTSGATVYDISLTDRSLGTLYGRLGNVIGWMAIGLTALLPAVSSWWGRRGLRAE